MVNKFYFKQSHRINSTRKRGHIFVTLINYCSFRLWLNDFLIKGRNFYHGEKHEKCLELKTLISVVQKQLFRKFLEKSWEKQPWRSRLLVNLQTFQPATLLKKVLQHGYFLLYFQKVSRITLLQNTVEYQLLILNTSKI